MGNSTLTKKQKFLAGVVCSLIILTLTNTAFSLLSPASDAARELTRSPLYVVFMLLAAVLNALLLLKFLLPNWEPHKKWLGWLLGASLIFAPLMLIAMVPSMGGFWEQQAMDASAKRNMLIVMFIAIPIAFALVTLISPYFHLLRGIVRKKSTEKAAGVVSTIMLAFTSLSQISAISSGTFGWRSILPIITSVGFTILYFSWPLLSRPILEPQKKEILDMNGITFSRNPAPKQKPADQSALGFGVYFTDHMFLMTYDDGQGWHDPRIVPYGPIALDPAAMCLHYGQEVFEGMKAYLGADGRVRLFRPAENMARLNLSNERLCIPQIDEAFAVHAIEELVKADRDWIPTRDGASLYIRPYIFATDPHVGVRPSKQYIFAVILSPVGAYYASGLAPVKIFVEEKYVRAVKGGMGFTKAAANYAASLRAQEEAHKLGYSQVLWLDGVERKYIEEVGTMNVFFVIGDEIITPALQGSILSGITRKSCIEILRSRGLKVTERPLALEEVVAAAKAGTLREAFGSGTAAVVSPIGELACGGETLSINNGEIGPISQRLYDELTGIQWGKIADPYGWTKVIG